MARNKGFSLLRRLYRVRVLQSLVYRVRCSYVPLLILRRSPYRAPELLFGARDYDPLAVDLWCLGATLAEFFTSLKLVDRFGDSDSSESSDNELDSESPLQPFIVPSNLKSNIRLPTDKWCRDSLFDASRGSIGLAWSIFKIRGTPNTTNWPVRTNLFPLLTSSEHKT